VDFNTFRSQKLHPGLGVTANCLNLLFLALQAWDAILWLFALILLKIIV